MDWTNSTRMSWYSIHNVVNGTMFESTLNNTEIWLCGMLLLIVLTLLLNCALVPIIITILHPMCSCITNSLFVLPVYLVTIISLSKRMLLALFHTISITDLSV